MYDPRLPVDCQYIDDDEPEFELDEFGDPIIPGEADFTGASDELGYANDR